MGQRRARRTWLARVSGLALAGGLAAGAPALAADDAASSGATVSEIVVTAQKLDQARDTIQPQIGASTYSITSDAIKAMPGGDNIQLDQVILQAPGVAEDSYGQIHVRGEHNGLQFRLNGVILPEGLSVFSQALSPRLADKVELITGALPAEYGLHTAGIIDITTKTGTQNGGSVTLYGGQRDEINPSITYSGGSGSFNYFVSASYMHNDLGIESPDGSADPHHDSTDQFNGFAYLEDIIDPQSRVSLILGSSDQRFEIPDLVGGQPTLGLSVAGPASAPISSFPSQDLNETQRENTQFAALSYLHATDRLTTQVSLYGRYSTLNFIPDQLGDLLYNGVAQVADKTDIDGGLQAEGVYRLSDAHTVRGGIILEIDRSTSNTSSQVLPTAGFGGPQTSNVPITIIDNGEKTAKTYSAYLQDEWKLPGNLTLNYGLRFDQYDGYRDENQLSPRANLVWQPTSTTTLHAGYSRYFSPPPFELVGSETVSKFNNTSGASEVTADTTPYAERANYYDVGISQTFVHDFTVGLDTYYKTDKNLVDEGQFGAPIILTPFNYAVGRQYGVELTGSYNHGPFSAYANFAAQSAKGKDIISSQFSFDAADLAYIANHFIDLDHSASYTVSAGTSYRLGATRIGGDLLYGSGLRADFTQPDGQVIPNGETTPAYVQINLSISHRFETAPGGPILARMDVINAFDKTIELRDGSGVGVFAPQFGPRRGFFFGVTKEF